MAIQIRSAIAVSPNPFRPHSRRLHCRHTLRSNRTAESVRMVYTLAAGNNVFFKDRGTRTKRVEREETVGRANTKIEHRFELEIGTPRTQIVRVTVRYVAGPAQTRDDDLNIL